MAQLIVHVLHRHGHRIEVVGKSKAKVKWIKKIADKIYLGNNPPPKSFTWVVEASGSPSGWETAVKSVEPRGKIFLKSTYAEGFDFNPVQLVVDEVSVIGSRCGPFKPALAALSDGLDLHYLIDRIYPFNKAVQAFEHAGKAGTLKILLSMATI